MRLQWERLVPPLLLMRRPKQIENPRECLLLFEDELLRGGRRLLLFIEFRSFGTPASCRQGKTRMSSHPRMRRNGSPTPATSLGGGGTAATVATTAAAAAAAAAVAAGGVASSNSRLQPMRATVPFQLKQHGSPMRSGGGVPRATAPPPPPPPSSSRSASPTRPGGARGACSSNNNSSPAVATQTPVGVGGSACCTAAVATTPLSSSSSSSSSSTRGSPTRAGGGGARGSPPRLHQLPPPLPGSTPSPCSSPVSPPVPESSACSACTAATSSGARIRHRQRRRSPEQSRASPERKSPSSPVCKGVEPRGSCGRCSGVVCPLSGIVAIEEYVRLLLHVHAEGGLPLEELFLLGHQFP